MASLAIYFHRVTWLISGSRSYQLTRNDLLIAECCGDIADTAVGKYAPYFKKLSVI